MAIQKDLTISLPVMDLQTSTIVTSTSEVSSAYIKITRIFGNKSYIGLEVTIYQSDKTTAVTQKTYAFPPSVAELSTNFIKQGYEYLKTLDDFKDATDC